MIINMPPFILFPPISNSLSLYYWRERERVNKRKDNNIMVKKVPDFVPSESQWILDVNLNSKCSKSYFCVPIYHVYYNL